VEAGDERPFVLRVAVGHAAQHTTGGYRQRERATR
jgi:hypothetical protein